MLRMNVKVQRCLGASMLEYVILALSIGVLVTGAALFMGNRINPKIHEIESARTNPHEAEKAMNTNKENRHGAALIEYITVALIIGVLVTGAAFFRTYRIKQSLKSPATTLIETKSTAKSNDATKCGEEKSPGPNEHGK